MGKKSEDFDFSENGEKTIEKPIIEDKKAKGAKTGPRLEEGQGGAKTGPRLEEGQGGAKTGPTVKKMEKRDRKINTRRDTSPTDTSLSSRQQGRIRGDGDENEGDNSNYSRRHSSFWSKINLWLALVFLTLGTQAAQVRIKDISRIKGVRENQLTGYGVVVGLDGTGDKTSPAMRSIINIMRNYGIEMNSSDIKANNAAAVFITATLPPFASVGDKIDVVLSSMGDAQDLQGGVLLQAPLIAADGQIYGVAAGPISIGGFNAGVGGAGTQKNHKTVATIPNGAIVERGVDEGLNIGEDGQLSFLLKEKDFSTSSRMATAINQKFGSGRAMAISPGEVMVNIPMSYTGREIEFIGLLEGISFEPDTLARIVINERTGTVIMGADTRISPVAISHGDLTIRISDMPDDNNNDGPFREKPGDAEAQVIFVPESTTISDIIQALNMMGAKSRDIIAIFQALKSAGALHAELDFI